MTVQDFKLSELPARCHGCGTTGWARAPFYVIDVAIGVVDGEAVSNLHGLARLVSGGREIRSGHLGVAQALSPTSHVARAAPVCRLFLCLDCFVSSGPLAAAFETVGKLEESDPANTPPAVPLDRKRGRTRTSAVVLEALVFLAAVLLAGACPWG